MNNRIFVEAKPEYQTKATLLFDELTRVLDVTTLKSVRVIALYDLFKFEDELSADTIKNVLHTELIETVLDEEVLFKELEAHPSICIESLPGQYDQRADSLQETLYLEGASREAKLSTATLYLFNEDLSDEDLKTIQNYLFNPIDTRLKDPKKLVNPMRYVDSREPEAVPSVKDFIHMTRSKLIEYRLHGGLAMELADLEFIQKYFRDVEKRNPTETEILVLDTYWSDHCRHTTFETALTSITFEKSQFQEQIQEAYDTYRALREKTNRLEKPETLMDMGTIFGRYQRQTGELADMEVSDEVNACSVKIDVDVDGKIEPWLLMFKNETHNHPTEIEPFGGASTCVGGAIRDPLSGRAFVYQAMRITGAADILQPVNETLENKLPQRKITLDAARGNSSYGNQIGSTTAFVKEFFHPGFAAKRMELGAVVGAVPENQVVRENPIPGDIVIMLGGKTGRDGVGGATGSSQVQTASSIETAGSEVQKGSPVEERKIVRLFRKPEVTKLIKKSNDFGAGGVSVAIGELADGVDVNLDVVPTKYAGLNGTELAISESQERMAVVVAASDADAFIQYCEEESIEAVKVAEVTELPRLVIRWKGQKVVDIAREFLDTNGIRKENEAVIVDSDLPSPLLLRTVVDDNEKTWVSLMKQYAHASQKGLQSKFDFSLGRSTVLAPYGGKYQMTQAESSVQKIQTMSGETNTVSIIAHGYNPYIGEWSPFHGASYAVIESVARIVATGADWTRVRLTFQEYFERLDNIPEKFGRPVAALLGSIQAQKMFNLPSIGGKDSMSGTFNDIDVPPTLVSFAVTSSQVDRILSPEFKASGEYIYLLPVAECATNTINYVEILRNFETFESVRNEYGITAASSVRQGGVAEVLATMSFGNRIGISLENIDSRDLFRPQYGAFVITTKKPLPESDRYINIGTTRSEYHVEYQDKVILGSTLEAAYTGKFESVFGDVNSIVYSKEDQSLETVKDETVNGAKLADTARVFIPVFPGTHSEYDSAKAFEKAGAEVVVKPFRMLTEAMIEESIDEMVAELEKANIFMLASGFISTDEPMNAGIATTILENAKVKQAVTEFIARGGLILGLNGGMSALVNTGLLPFGEYKKAGLTMALNQGGELISALRQMKIVNRASAWLNTVKAGDLYTVPFATQYGRLTGDQALIETLIANGQVVSQWVDGKGNAIDSEEANISGSTHNIDGLISPNGQILGLMGNVDRYESGLFINIAGNKALPIFESAVQFVTGQFN